MHVYERDFSFPHERTVGFLQRDEDVQVRGTCKIHKLETEDCALDGSHLTTCHLLV